ncbi:MAG: Phosphoserine phosphatase RsbU [Spirochaetes bacterium ADurb.BinA120]|nr:MAG: Phosphoserine phosphatase RsbU [Spirochaetes bacterium ADurb.BinA120]
MSGCTILSWFHHAGLSAAACITRGTRSRPKDRTMKNSSDRKTLNLAKISSINRQINSRMSLPELLAAIMETAREIVHAAGASLLLSDPSTGDLIFNIVMGEHKEEIKGEKVPRGAGIVGIVAETGKPLIVNNAQNDPRVFKNIDSKSSFITRNIICVPMTVQERNIGVLEAVNSIGRDAFDGLDVKLLSYIADQAAIAITNRRLVDELTSRIKELTALHEISQTVSFSRAEGDLLETIIASMPRSLGVSRASLLLYDQAKNSLVLRSGHGFPDDAPPGQETPIDGSISGYVFRTGDPLIVADRERELAFIGIDSRRVYRTPSFISVPVRGGNDVIGVLNVADKTDSSIFNAFDLRVMSTIANYVTEALRNIEYEKDKEARRRFAQELDIAAEIQRKILPSIPPDFGSHRLAAFNRPAKEVGGDFYDFFNFGSNKYGLVVGDVSGKGIPAALFMGSARNVMRAEARISTQPEPLLVHSNRYVYDDSEYGMFVTAFYVTIDVHNRLLTYGSAGHNDQLLIKKNGRQAVHLNASGRALGLSAESTYEERVYIYEPGDLLLLFTDGVLDYLGEGDIDRGEERLIEIANRHFDEDPSAIIARFSDLISNNAVDNYFLDDFTILSVKF